MKFGGSSVANASRMREVAGIICSFPDELPCIVLSAMGKVWKPFVTLCSILAGSSLPLPPPPSEPPLPPTPSPPFPVRSGLDPLASGPGHHTYNRKSTYGRHILICSDFYDHGFCSYQSHYVHVCWAGAFLDHICAKSCHCNSNDCCFQCRQQIYSCKPVKKLLSQDKKMASMWNLSGIALAKIQIRAK